MKVTLKDIAKIAGVHRSTVDKVLHGREGVSTEVRERIMRIAEELEYEPNVIGKALAFQKNPLEFAVVLLNFDALNDIKDGIEQAREEFQDFGLRMTFYVTHYDISEQLATIDLIKTKKISGLIISPLNDARIQNAINDLVESGIPVITVNLDSPQSQRLCFVGQDMAKAGTMAGELMGEIIGGSGKIALIVGSKDSISQADVRADQFRHAIASAYPEIHIADIVETHENGTVAFENTLALLRDTPDLKGIYITCGNVGEIGKAIKLMKKSTIIKVICFDSYPEIIQLIRDGVVNFTLTQDLFAQGYQSVKTLFDYVFYRRTPTTERLTVAIDIKFRGNID